MEIIYTPWRYEYVSRVDEAQGCIFCDRIAEQSDRENLVVERGDRCFVILNRYPYTSGHLMIAPYEHVGSIEGLDMDTIVEMMTRAREMMRALREAFSPDGFNLGINIARVAGAGITDHVHMHVVPRWAGDSNFMPVTGGTKVLPLTLDQVWLALSKKA